MVPPEFRNLNTLDEPVCETIVSFLQGIIYFQKRDLAKIWYKLRVVINPITPFLSDDKRKEIRNCKSRSRNQCRGSMGTFHLLPYASSVSFPSNDFTAL